jgi:hypothetical protein
VKEKYSFKNNGESYMKKLRVLLLWCGKRGRKLCRRAGKIPFPGNGDSRRNTSTGADLLWQHHAGGRGSLLAGAVSIN